MHQHSVPARRRAHLLNPCSHSSPPPLPRGKPKTHPALLISATAPAATRGTPGTNARPRNPHPRNPHPVSAALASTAPPEPCRLPLRPPAVSFTPHHARPRNPHPAPPEPCRLPLRPPAEPTRGTRTLYPLRSLPFSSSPLPGGKLLAYTLHTPADQGSSPPLLRSPP